MPEAAIVLAGGRSRRMGRDKASLPFGPETLLARVLRTVAQVVDEVVVVAREGQELPEVDARVVRDPAEGRGPLAGLAAGLEAIAADRAFLVSCDVPFLEPALVARLLELAHGRDAAVPQVDGHHMTTTAVYARSVLPDARALLDEDRLRPLFLLERVDARVVTADDLRDVDPGLRSFLNCNTPEEYTRALEQAGFGGSDVPAESAGAFPPAADDPSRRPLTMGDAETRSDEFTRTLEERRRRSFPRGFDEPDPASQTTVHVPEHLRARSAPEPEPEPEPEPGRPDGPGEGPEDESDTLPPFLPVPRDLALDPDQLVTIGEPGSEPGSEPEAPEPPSDGGAEGATGLDRAALVAGGRTLFVYAGGGLRLGRTSPSPGGNDVCLRHRPAEGHEKLIRRISSSHIRIEVDADGARLFDLESTGGTTLDGEALEPQRAAPLPDGARVGVAGVLDLYVRVYAAGAEAPAVWLTRPDNGGEHSYLLVPDRVGLRGGAEGLRPQEASGVGLSVQGGGLVLLDSAGERPLRDGERFTLDGLAVAVRAISPGDQKG